MVFDTLVEADAIAVIPHPLQKVTDTLRAEKRVELGIPNNTTPSMTLKKMKLLHGILSRLPPDIQDIDNTE